MGQDKPKRLSAAHWRGAARGTRNLAAAELAAGRAAKARELERKALDYDARAAAEKD